MNKQMHLLLADDDEDDRFFFTKVLTESGVSARLTTVKNGEKLMDFLSKNSTQLPDVLFLDLNMPRKNGSECLSEIKRTPKLRGLPVVIYSTSLNEDVADLLYENGAHYYVRKAEISELRKVMNHILRLIAESKFVRPERDKFILMLISV